MAIINLVKIPIPPPLTCFYIALTTTLSILTSIIRLQTFNRLIIDQPNLLFNDIIIPSIQLVPNQSIFNPWTFLSEPFVETNILKYFISIIILYFGITYLERHWNLNNENKIFSETVYFITIISIITNFITVLIKFIIALSTSSSSTTDLSLPVEHGIFSISMSFIVVLKQLSPEHNIKLLKTISIRIRQLPFLILSLTFLLSLIRLSITPIVPIFTNFYITWVYLRYYQLNNIADLLPSTTTTNSTSNSNSLVRGDASDTFAFIQFFPSQLQSYLKPLCRLTYHSSVFLGLFKPFNDDDIESGNLRTIKRLNTINSGGSMTGEIADRRRQVALKVLGDRVGVTNTNTNANTNVNAGSSNNDPTTTTN